jgi:hypothetical protein
MNRNLENASQQLSSIEAWNREPDSSWPQSHSDYRNEHAREAVALFPAGRFFRFPVRVKIRLAPALYAEQAFHQPNDSDSSVIAEELRTEIGNVAWALIENASCIDLTHPLPEIFFFGEVVVDFRRMELRRCGKPIEATAHEFKTLRYFVTHPEVPISREELLNQVWGFHRYPTTRTVDNRIMQLRKKLEADPAKPTHFVTVCGVGYKFVP